jgi:antitoxin component YwqK of YwqJK toxin-antitoxin module
MLEHSPTIRRVEEYYEDGALLSKYWFVTHKGKQYGPFKEYDDAERTKYELMG